MERPIILKAHEVRGILEGRQTQLRRAIKTAPDDHLSFLGKDMKDMRAAWGLGGGSSKPKLVKCPFGQPGDRLWGRETWCDGYEYADECMVFDDAGNPKEMVFYRASTPELNWVHDNGCFTNPPWCSSTQMPRWASRILLEIVSVRVERLQDISQDDAKACGFYDGGCLTCGESSHPLPCGCANPRPDYVDAFVWQWLQDHGDCLPNNWIGNPWVWVIEFKRVEA